MPYSIPTFDQLLPGSVRAKTDSSRNASEQVHIGIKNIAVQDKSVTRPGTHEPIPRKMQGLKGC